MSDTQRKLVGFRLNSDESRRLDQIVAYLRNELGLPVNRSDAVRRLINRFELPAVPAYRNNDGTTEKAA